MTCRTHHYAIKWRRLPDRMMMPRSSTALGVEQPLELLGLSKSPRTGRRSGLVADVVNDNGMLSSLRSGRRRRMDLPSVLWIARNNVTIDIACTRS